MRNLYRLIILFITLPNLLGAQNAEEALKTKLNQLYEENAFVGFALAILKTDKVIFTQALGYADQKNEIAYTSQTVQPVASISKTLLGVSLMKAQEMGKLKLDDNINDYLPFKIINPNFPNEVITIRHLANHTAGIKDTKYYRKSYVFKTEIPDLPEDLPPGLNRKKFEKYIKVYRENKAMPLSDFLSKLYTPNGEWYSENHFLNKKPGTEFSYSNNGAALASLILEKATKMEYKSFTQKYILEPLGMTNSAWSLDNYALDQKSRQYLEGLEIPEFELITLADGGFVTNVMDFSKYLMAVMKGYQGEDNVLSAKSYDEMLKENIHFGKGIFWNVKVANKDNFIGHSGGDPGVTTLMFFEKESNYGYVFFSNTSGSDRVQAMSKVIRALRDYTKKLEE